MGLDSRVASTSKDKPAAPPCMTPKKVALAASQTPSVSVTDLESRRKTPIKAAVTVATPSRTGAGNDAGTDSMAAAAATPRTLRSPAALSSSQAHADYSTASDFLTLMKVLKTVPGTSNVTDAEPQATPSLSRSGFGFPLSSNLPLSSGFGDSTMVTPRLPVSRYGLNDITAATPLQQHLRSQPTVGLYQTATPVSRKSGSEGSKGASKDRSSGDIEYLEPHEVLEKYGIERDMFDWVENMRSWFVRHLLRPLCKQIDELDELFQQNGLGHLSCRKAVLDAQALEQAKNASTVAPGGLFGSRLGTTSVLGGTFGSGFGSSAINPISTQANQSQSNVPQTLVDLSLRYGDLPQTKERMALEKYLLVPGFDNSREYIVQRVHTLAQSGALPGYVFDGGASYIADAEPGTTTAAGSGVGSGASHSGLPSSRERPWNQAQHPTDGQLLFHLFCAFMDQVMPPVQNIRHAFTDRYVLQPDRKPNYNLPAQIIQVVRKRPHFCLVVKGSFYDVSAGRNNLFVTLILFVLEIQRECAGYLGLTNLGGKHVDLLSVLKNKSAFGT
ncbi:hypothetical protein GGI07_004193 [Coemansia sp. Benny D115]|nr:hypothetical protein GGI07_004193 [Coemansia sp. Benny D115]